MEFQSSMSAMEIEVRTSTATHSLDAIQSSMSAMEMEVRTSTATHSLYGISEQHVSNGNGGQNINSNSQTGWNLRAACQQWKSEYQQQLTPWMEFQSSMSAMEIRISTATANHRLDGISEQHVSN